MTSLTRRLFVALSLAGCGAATEPRPTTPIPAQDDDAMIGLTEHHRYHHHGGVTRFVAMSLDTLGVAPEEVGVVAKIHDELETSMAGARAAEESLTMLLADELEASTFDDVKVDAAVTDVANAAAAVHETSVEALNQLHVVLSPAERAALVDKVESHWAVWQKSNVETGTSGGYLVADLGLTPDQTTRLDVVLAGHTMAPLDPQEIASHLHAFGDAFRSATFDARMLGTARDANQHLAAWGAAHMAHFVEAASTVITPEQRSELAHQLREHATHDAVAKGTP